MSDTIITTYGQESLALLREAMVATGRWSPRDADTDLQQILTEIHPVRKGEMEGMRAALDDLPAEIRTAAKMGRIQHGWVGLSDMLDEWASRIEHAVRNDPVAPEPRR